MITDQFSSLLKELESFFHCQLVPDANNACLIRMQTGVEIQLELDRYGENLLIACRLNSPPPGRYRENVFKEALKSNSLQPPSFGTFGYSKKSDKMILFTKIALRYFNKESVISSILPAFVAKATTWHEALGRGDVPLAANDVPTPNQANSIFGLNR